MCWWILQIPDADRQFVPIAGVVVIQTNTLSPGFQGSPVGDAFRADLPIQFVQAVFAPRLAFPDDEGCPARLTECEKVPLVAHDVLPEFFQPELAPFCRHGRVLAEGMSMPEASVNEDGDAVSGKHEVRATRQRAVMEAEAQSGRVQVAPDAHFRTSVLAPDACHHPGPCFAVDDVGHCWVPAWVFA